MQVPARARVRFADFALDMTTGELRSNGNSTFLQEKPFQILALLLERPGQLVTRDELVRQLWADGTFVDFDQSLNKAVNRLREALGDSAEQPQFIETLPRRGYRFVAPVSVLPEPEVRPLEKPLHHQSFPSSSPKTGNVTPPAASANVERRPTLFPPWRSRVAFAAVVLAAGSGVGLLTYVRLSPPPVPRVLRTVQLTHSGRVDPWTRIVSDGSRIFFTEREGDHWNLVETSVAGGVPQTMAAPFQNTVIKDISPDHSNFLIASFTRRNEHMPLWIWPVQGGTPRRFGNIYAYDAAWSPNGHEIVYSKNEGLYLADVDGTNIRKLADVGNAGGFAWSIDGQTLRFSTWSMQPDGSVMWEVHSDGSQLRRLLPEWNQVPGECCANWTPDGKYFFFQSNKGGGENIWARREGRKLFRPLEEQPFRITDGPNDFGVPVAAKNTKSIFVYGVNRKGEVTRYDPKSHQFSPVLSGADADSLAYSRDGNWVAYRSVPDGTLSRMKRDGTQRLAIAPSSLRGYSSSWSPDGKQIAFMGTPKDQIERIFVASIEGGAVRELYPESRMQVDPAWSPDGKFLAFSREQSASASEDFSSFAIQLLELSTNQLSVLPGSEGMRSPAWSPDGRFLAAVAQNYHKLMLFDLQARQWAQLAEGSFIWGKPSWSSTGACVYYQDSLIPGQPIYCVRPTDRRRTAVLTFEPLLQGTADRVGFIGLTPDGSFLFLLERNYSDIYSLDLDLP